ncbi:hypothetical protein Ddye_013358 [Dipteronia dyeriana]|uniref:RRM domain-containing protein n=1 Tax=Dipteronia dyeriana TaxID=168575 RepID=A0AAE0CJI6_9ROSI|nr:hypothetical protein Ddye_013358 [Dipteronia dyeriana]
MRNNCRERNSGADRQRRLKDFQENLVSIFVDNLNLQVDQAFLWSLFKVFGKVRDIYLSAFTERRKIGYAFMRFGTIEEARRVADKTNGMHVFGWSIRAKVAQNGWKSRRMVNEGVFTRNSKFMDEDNITRKEGSFKKGQGGSYDDVVKVNTDEKGTIEEIYAKTAELVVTESVISEGLWLQNSVVVVMRSFANITRVKKRLWNRVVRSFDQKPVWFNFKGVTLDYWNDAFFKKLGSKFGELALVEEGTSLRKRLDSARLLLLVSLAKVLPKFIKVVDGHRNFSVCIETDVIQMDIHWINEFLGLKDEINGGSRSNEEGNQFQNQVDRVVEKVARNGVNPKGNRTDKSRGVSRKQSNEGGGQIDEAKVNATYIFHQNLEEEIALVIETGVSLGIDFNGKIMEMKEVIARCEKEEIDRIETTRKG